MTVSKTRGAARKLGPISFGSKIVRFRVANIDKRFTVHEDLICRTSALFKTQLQNNRKLRKSSRNATFEECCICQEHLNPVTKDITYCVTCGNDIHDTCIEKWKRTSVQRDSGRVLPTCPICRAPWKNEPLLKHLNVADSLDAEAVQIYLDWMYSSTVRIPAAILRSTDDFNFMLLKCWSVASAVQDTSFRDAIIHTFFTDAGARFWTSSVQWAFVEDQANAEIKDFVIQVFMAFVQPGWFRREGKKWPSVFVRSLADKMLEEITRKDYDEVREAWLKKVEVEGEEVEEEGEKGVIGGEEAQENVVLDYQNGARDPAVKKSTRVLRDRRSMGLQPGSLKEPSYEDYN